MRERNLVGSGQPLSEELLTEPSSVKAGTERMGFIPDLVLKGPPHLRALFLTVEWDNCIDPSLEIHRGLQEMTC